MAPKRKDTDEFDDGGDNAVVANESIGNVEEVRNNFDFATYGLQEEIYEKLQICDNARKADLFDEQAIKDADKDAFKTLETYLHTASEW